MYIDFRSRVCVVVAGEFLRLTISKIVQRLL